MRPLTKLITTTALGAISLLSAGCGEEDASSVRIRLNPDFSGTISTSSIVITPVPPAGSSGLPGSAGVISSAGAEPVLSGAIVTNRGQLVMTAGTFAELDLLKVADITFEYGGGHKSPFVKVTIPRGKAALWPKALGVPDEAMRAATAKALVPESKSSAIGSVTTLRFAVPDNCKIVSVGVSGRARGLNTAADETNASITIPMAVARGEFGTEPLVWHITWQPRPAAAK